MRWPGRLKGGASILLSESRLEHLILSVVLLGSLDSVAGHLVTLKLFWTVNNDILTG